MKIIKLFMVVAIAMLMCTVVLATASATTVSIEKKENGVTFESKEKAVTFKVTWNANGGKIGSKKTMVTTVKKGSKIAKLPATPKRSGYTFSAWYTKKDGGKKITKNTKPTKSLTYYAQWNKVLNAEEKKLIGQWDSTWTSRMWVFQKDGTFYDYSDFGSDGKYQTKGYYSLKNGVLTTLSQTRSTLHSNPNWDIIPWGKLGTHKYNVRFETENGKQYGYFGGPVPYIKSVTQSNT